MMEELQAKLVKGGEALDIQEKEKALNYRKF